MGVLSAIGGFLSFSNVHGVHYLADKETPILGKLFWFISISLCWFASTLLILSSWEEYQNNSISFVVDTVYLNWTIDFPAVFVCESSNDLTDDYVEQLWGDDAGLYVTDIFNEIAFFKGQAAIAQEQCVKPENFEACEMDFRIISENVRHSCNGLFKLCEYNNKPFNCCSYFMPFYSEIGKCYAINSEQTKHLLEPGFGFFSSRYKDVQPGKLHFQITSPSDVYILSTEQVPSIWTPDYEYKMSLGQQREFVIMKREVVNEHGVREVDIEKRKCRYIEENYLTVQRFYSHTGCIVEERKRAHFKFCNCTHHLMPNPGKICDLAGLICLQKHYDESSIIKPPWAQRKGLVIDCLPACDEDDITILHTWKGFLPRKTHADITISINAFPTDRFTRAVVRDKLELAVSVAGTVGLFIGASVLSVVEIFYYFTMRYWQPTIPDEPAEEEQLRF